MLPRMPSTVYQIDSNSSLRTGLARPGDTLVITTDVASSGRVGRLPDAAGTGQGPPGCLEIPTSYTDVPNGSTVTLGPFGTPARFVVECAVGRLTCTFVPIPDLQGN